MLTIKYRKSFKKDYKKAQKSHQPMDELWAVIEKLQKQEPLDWKYRDHLLTNYAGRNDVRDCHIRPDFVLVYSIQDEVLILELIRLGSHSEVLQ